MHIFEQIFWIFFAAVAAWIAWGVFSMWLDHLRRESEVPRRRTSPPSPGHGTFGTGGTFHDSTAGMAGIGAVDIAGSASGSGEYGSVESGGSESGGGDSGGGDSGGGDFSGGGGDSGGGGSSGGW